MTSIDVVDMTKGLLSMGVLVIVAMAVSLALASRARGGLLLGLIVVAIAAAVLNGRVHPDNTYANGQFMALAAVGFAVILIVARLVYANAATTVMPLQSPT